MTIEKLILNHLQESREMLPFWEKGDGRSILRQFIYIYLQMWCKV